MGTHKFKKVLFALLCSGFLFVGCREKEYHQEVVFFIQNMEDDDVTTLYINQRNVAKLTNSKTLPIPCNDTTWNNVVWTTLDREKNHIYLTSEKQGIIFRIEVQLHENGDGAGYIANSPQQMGIVNSFSEDRSLYFIGINTGLDFIEYEQQCHDISF